MILFHTFVIGYARCWEQQQLEPDGNIPFYPVEIYYHQSLHFTAPFVVSLYDEGVFFFFLGLSKSQHIYLPDFPTLFYEPSEIGKRANFCLYLCSHGKGLTLVRSVQQLTSSMRALEPNPGWANF